MILLTAFFLQITVSGSDIAIPHSIAHNDVSTYVGVTYNSFGLTHCNEIEIRESNQFSASLKEEITRDT